MNLGRKKREKRTRFRHAERRKNARTHRWRCSETVAGLAQSRQLGISPVRGWDWRRGTQCVAGTARSGNTVSRREERTPLGVAASVAMDGAGTRPCTEDRSTAAQLSWSGRRSASRASGAVSGRRMGIKASCSHSPYHRSPLKSRNPQEKTSACLRVGCSVHSGFTAVRRGECVALSGTVDSEVVLKAHGGSLNSRVGLGSAMWRLRGKRPKALNRVLCLSLGIPTARFPIISLVN